MPPFRRRGRAKPADGSMTLMEHLHELRHRVFLAVLALFIGAVIGFVWFSVGIPALHIRTLGDILTEPYCAIPSPPRVEFTGPGSCSLLAHGVFSALQLRLTAAVLAGFLLTCPVWLYQIWAYVGPALYSKEKRFAIGFTGVGALLFVGGMVLAYLVIPEALRVLVGFGSDFVSAAFDPVQYYKFLVGMMLIFGVSLELPLLLVMLNYAGVIKGAKLAQVRRYAFFGLVVFAGITVPGNDPTSMGVLAVVLCILYEVAVQVSKAHDRRKAKAAANAYADLPDDVASPMNDDGSSFDDGASPVADETAQRAADLATEPIPPPTATAAGTPDEPTAETPAEPTAETPDESVDAPPVETSDEPPDEPPDDPPPPTRWTDAT